MKRPIEWHEECLRNSIISQEQRKAQLESIKKEVERGEKIITFHKVQILEAKRRGLTAFDGTKLMVRKKETE